VPSVQDVMSVSADALLRRERAILERVAQSLPLRETLEAIALQSADVILFDERVSMEILDFARREAKKLLVGKASDDTTSELMLGLAKAGRRVIRLSGVAQVGAQAGSDSVVAACRKAGIAVEVVPGVTEVGLKDTPQHDNAETRVA